MSVTITASFEAANITELQQLLTLVADNEPITMSIEGTFDWDYSHLDPIDMSVDDEFEEREFYAGDQTPPQGLSRDVVEAATQVWIHALVTWVREHCTTGPLTEVSDMTMYQAFRRFHERGVECGIGDLTDGLDQDMVLRGAFRDATGAQVPL